MREDLSLPPGSMFFNRFQKIGEGDLRGRNVLTWVIKGMDVPTDKGVINTGSPGFRGVPPRSGGMVYSAKN
jgi:hypothetical protein